MRPSRRSGDPPSPGIHTPSSQTPGGRSVGNQPIDVGVDFELDVVVEIDSGQCVLHPKETKGDNTDGDVKR